MARRALALLTASLAAACGGTTSSDTPASPPPAPVILVPHDGALLGLADAPSGHVTFSGTSVSGARVAVEVGSAEVCQATTASDRTWSCQGTVTEGARQALAKATLSPGGASPFSIAVTFTLDLTPPPVPAVLVPVPGTHLAAPGVLSTQVAVSGTAAAGVTVDVQMDGVHVATVTAAGDGSWSTNATLTASGRYTALARTVDDAGNGSGFASSAFSLSLARTAETLTFPPGTPLPVTAWGQSVPSATQSPSSEIFPGQANSWVLYPDFSFVTGFGAQYQYALQVGLSPVVNPDHLTADFSGYGLFPVDQSRAEVAFLSPRFGTADGVITAAASDGVTMGIPPLDGSYSGYLNATSDSRLSRNIEFDPGLVYTISWTHEVFLDLDPVRHLAGSLDAPYAPRFQVVLRDPANGMSQFGDPLYVVTVDFDHASPSIAVVWGGASPKDLVLSFELHGELTSYGEIDQLTIDAGSGPVDPGNGNFESGLLTPWVANAGAESQNVRSGPRTVVTGGSALVVTRAVYAPPAATWARVVDVFENQTVSTVTTSAVYSTVLLTAAPLAAVTQYGAAVVGWGPAGEPERDVGLVLGNGAAYLAADYSQIFIVHALEVAPLSKVALVHFVVQLGESAGGLTVADVPANTDAVCGQIVNDFPQDQYWQDLEPGVMQIIRNF
ncbi:MAG TPA: hypothetical protein VF875_17085 [Anaeromyxobacter sp.]